jgi:gamma-glutamylcyclotransferase (GGCT)/AIG2-like uncharacterized protein YtfP
MKEMFLYGTLKKGGKWHQLVANEEFLGNDIVNGEKYMDKNGYYPILFVGTDEILGEVYNVSPEAHESFKKWLESTPKDSDSFREFVHLGGDKNI